MERAMYTELNKAGITAITAHAGCEGTVPNSREHILAAIASGAEIMEVDVRRYKDFLYLGHDIPEDPEKSVRLSECFELVAPQQNLCLNLDMKVEGLMAEVLELAGKYGLCSRIVFTGEANKCRAQANAYGAEVWHSMWKGDSVPEGVEYCLKDGSPTINIDKMLITDGYDALLRANGLTFSAWTVDDEEGIRRFLKMGVRNITTRKPVLALKLRREMQGA